MEDVAECVMEVKESGEEATYLEINVLQIKESIKQEILPTVDPRKPHHDFYTIHRVCSKLRDADESSYNPRLVSIGPYHHGNKTLEEMQLVKPKYLDDLIKRSSDHESALQKYIETISKKTSEAKKQYSGLVNLELEEFVKMMVVDGCFLLEFMLKSYLNDKKDQANIVKTKMSLLMNDLLLVENQIPFFILKDLFKVYKQLDNNQDKNNDTFTIEVLALFCFSPADRLDAQVAAKAFEEDEKSFLHLLHLHHSSLNQHPDKRRKYRLQSKELVQRIFMVSSEHNWGDALYFVPVTIVVFSTISFVFIIKVSWLLIKVIISIMLSMLWDLIKLVLLPPLSLYVKFIKYLATGRIEDYEQWTSGIPNARYLRDTGFEFKKDTTYFMDVTCSGRTIKIPVLYMQQTTIIHYKNLLALEHSSGIYGYEFTSFAKFMDYLIDTEEDVAILRESGIIDNRLGKDEQVAFFFNNLLKGIHIRDEDVLMFDCVQKYYTNGYYKVKFFQWRRKLVPEYFSNPWAIPSMIAAFILLVLTMLQTFFTIYPYYHPRHP